MSPCPNYTGYSSTYCPLSFSYGIMVLNIMVLNKVKKPQKPLYILYKAHYIHHAR